jgi:hypothetical protein
MALCAKIGIRQRGSRSREEQTPLWGAREPRSQGLIPDSCPRLGTAAPQTLEPLARLVVELVADAASGAALLGLVLPVSRRRQLREEAA